MEHQHSPAARRSRDKGPTYGSEELAAMAAQLRALPPVDVSKRRTNKQGAIRYLADEIVALQERGYTMEEVTDRLNRFGLDITTPTLKSYLHRAKDDGTKHSKARRRRRAVERQPVSAAHNVASANSSGTASSEAPAELTNPGAPDHVAKAISSSRPLHPENVPHPSVTADRTIKAATPTGGSPLPWSEQRNDVPNGDVSAARVSVPVPRTTDQIPRAVQTGTAAKSGLFGSGS
jgi:hypothetical protein